jgi:hypothetical protein
MSIPTKNTWVDLDETNAHIANLVPKKRSTVHTRRSIKRQSSYSAAHSESAIIKQMSCAPS